MKKATGGGYATFIPRLDLSTEDERELCARARDLVDAAVDEYQQYREGVADWTQWKEVRRHEAIRVFRERQSVTKNRVDVNGAQMLPEMLVVGNVASTLDDVMYGAVATTANAMTARSRYAPDGMLEAKILRSITEPTVDEPFHQLSVRWSAFSPGQGCSTRDCTYLEFTGFVSTESGERLGVVLTHSVDFVGVPALQTLGVVRAHMATWAIYRVSGPGLVQCFVKSFLDLGPSMWRAVGLKCVSERALAMCKYAHCCEMKKLARLLHVAVSDEIAKPRAARETCAACVIPLSSTMLGASTRRCGICREEICTRCAHKKSICDALAGAMRALLVCSACIKAATQTSAWHIKTDEVVHTGTPAATLLAMSQRSTLWTSSAELSDTDDDAACKRLTVHQLTRESA